MKFQKKHLYFLLILCNLLLIWGNSCMPASTSGAVSAGALSFLQRLFGGLGWLGEFLLRKLAHFCEFALLGLLLCRHAQLRKAPSPVSGTMLIGLLCACIDETIQLFSPGRSSQLTDVWVDFAGICAGLVFLALCRFLFARIHRKTA